MNLITIIKFITMNRILVIDGHDRRALASVRSLGKKKDCSVYIGSNKKINASRYSKYCSGFFKYQNPDTNLEDFLFDLNQILEKNAIDVLIPMDDRMASYIAENQEKIFSSTKILIPKWEVFKIARDKALTLSKALDCDIPIPTWHKPEEVLESDDSIFPLIIKPRISSASMGMVVCNNNKDFQSLYQRIHSKYPNPIIQSKIASGGGHFQANIVLDKNSNLVCSSVKNKIREYPLTGGPSTFFRTVDFPLIEEMGIKLLQKIQWVGPAEVEFMIDPTNNQPVLMEINPRMSATIVLSIFAGVDFPYHIVSSAIGKPTSYAQKNKNFNYYCQWLIPGDLLNFITNKDRFNQEFSYFFGKPKPHLQMNFDKKDLKPYFVNLWIIISALVNPKKIIRFIFRR